MTTLDLPFQRPADIDSRRLKLSLIDVPEEYEPQDKDSLGPDDHSVKDESLLNSIKKSGVQQSIIVIPEGDRFTVVKGARRVRIAHVVGLKDIPAIVNHPPAGANLKRYRDHLRMVLTQARQDLLPSQRSGLIKQLMENFKMNQRDVAEYLGVDAGSITNWKAIEHYSAPVVRLIDSGVIKMFAARSFDGMKPEVQMKVYRSLEKDFANLPGGKLHKLVRAKYSPKSHPDFYVAPEKTLEKMSRSQGKRAGKTRTHLTRSEKELYARDLSLREVELSEAEEELNRLKKEIVLAAPTIGKIMANEYLLSLVPDEMREELGRFEEVKHLYC